MTSTNPFDDDPEVVGGNPSTDMMDNSNSNINMPNQNSNSSYNSNKSVTENFQIQRQSSSSFNNSLPLNMNMNTYNFPSESELDPLNDEDENVPVEASWQFLGDLPYRRIPVFKNVSWRNERDSTTENFNKKGGLAAFPSSWIKARQESSSSSVFSEDDLKQLLRSTTVTKVAGCPNGGPIAVMTLPLPTANLSSQVNSSTHIITSTELRIMMPSGRHLTSMDFPPPNLVSKVTGQPYSAADVLDIGFTDRTLLMVIMRDSTCLTYNLRGKPMLNPFTILTHSNTNSNLKVELIEASFFNGGVAVLSETMQLALVEFFDEHDDPSYAESAYFKSRKISSTDNPMSNEYNTAFGSSLPSFAGDSLNSSPSYSAIVTQFPTDAHARTNNYYYCTLAVLPRIHTSSQHPEIFLSTSDHSVIIADSYSLTLTDVDCRQSISSPIISMSFAPNGRFLACFTQSSVLTVISTSFETKVLDFDTSEGSASPPSQMQWCGEDSVILHWKNLGVLMVGPYGDWLRFPYDFTEELFLLPEMDCCRIITDSSTDILQRVPPATALFLRIGSIEPSAMLLDASDAFESGSPASDEAARAVSRTGLLTDAVETCSEAAMREFDVNVQKRLLRAASYGMHFVYKDQADHRQVMGGEEKVDFNGLERPDEDPEEKEEKSGESVNLSSVRPSPTGKFFVAAAKKVRILNALRNPAVGFAITSAQFDAITPPGIVARLVEVKRPSLATTVASYLALDKSVQTFARVCRAAAFIASDKGQSDTQTAESAMKLLNEDVLGLTLHQGNSPIRKNDNVLCRGGYASLALAAKSVGRPEVGKLLLRMETSIPDKVKGLVAIEAFDGAVSVANESRDSDLMFLSLLEFEKKSKDSDIDPAKGQQRFFNALINKCPQEASNLMKAYYSNVKDVKSIMALNLRGQKHIEAGSFMAKHALMQATERDRLTMLKEASRVYGLGKDAAFHKACTDEYLDLLFEQERIRKAFKAQAIAPVSSSVSDTLNSIITYAKADPALSQKIFLEADRLAKKFRVPEKRLWHIKVRALASSDQWAQLRILADTKAKVPIGFKPFALAAIKGKQPMGEIMRYVERVTTPEDRYTLFCAGKLWKRALDEARKLKDHGRVMEIYSICNSTEIQQMCDVVASQIS